MPSKKSYFNRTLFRKNLTRFWPMWALASAGGALFPLAYFIQILQNPGQRLPALELTSLYYDALAYVVPILALIYAVMCAEAVWGYLYNARSVGLMHTLPIRREGLFLTNFLSGMTMMLIPCVVVGTVTVLMSLGLGALDPTGVLVTALGILAETFFYFCTATLVAFCVGNHVMLPAVYLLLHFLAVLMDMLISLFVQGFLFGVNGGYSGTVEALSPTVYLLRHLQVQRIYEPATWTESGQMVRDTELVEIHMENLGSLAVYALVGVVCLAVAWALYRRRRSESAGDVVAVGWMKPVFRYSAAALSALAGGLFLYSLFLDDFRYGGYYRLLPMLICMMVAGSVGYYAASMLLSKSFQVFRKSGAGIAIVLVGCVAVCGILKFDVFHVETRVPEISEVSEVKFYAAENSYFFYPGEEDPLLEQVRQLHSAVIKDAEYYMALQRDGYTQEVAEDGQRSHTWIRLEYTLHNGRKVDREYSLQLTRDRMENPDTADFLLDQLINSQEMKTKRLYLEDSRVRVYGGYIRTEVSGGEHMELSDREAQATVEAVGQDLKAGTWGSYFWFDREREQNNGQKYAMDLELYFEEVSEQGEVKDTGAAYITVQVSPKMTHTVETLKRLELVDERDLKTNAELHPEAYGEWMTPGESPAQETVEETSERPMASSHGVLIANG